MRDRKCDTQPLPQATSNTRARPVQQGDQVHEIQEVLDVFHQRRPAARAARGTGASGLDSRWRVITSAPCSANSAET